MHSLLSALEVLHQIPHHSAACVIPKQSYNHLAAAVPEKLVQDLHYLILDAAALQSDDHFALTLKERLEPDLLRSTRGTVFSRTKNPVDI